jgi:hypothetical protein
MQALYSAHALLQLRFRITALETEAMTGPDMQRRWMILAAVLLALMAALWALGRVDISQPVQTVIVPVDPAMVDIGPLPDDPVEGDMAANGDKR